MDLGYNTNGLAHHRPLEAFALLAEVGYTSVALTLDANLLDPFQGPSRLHEEIVQVRDCLDRLGLKRVVETGARFLLNPRRKHDPTLLDPNPARRAQRSAFLVQAMEVAQALGAPLISIWSGTAPTSDNAGSGSGDACATDDLAVLWDRLIAELRGLLPAAERTGCVIAFEPEPGMFIDTMDRFATLDQAMAHPLFQLTLDLGHVHCLEPLPIPHYIRTWGHRIVNIHIEDMVRGAHDHLMFGAGTMEFPPIFEALRAVGYDGPLHVELSRHSPNAVEAVMRSYEFLKGQVCRAGPSTL